MQRRWPAARTHWIACATPATPAPTVAPARRAPGGHSRRTLEPRSVCYAATGHSKTRSGLVTARCVQATIRASAEVAMHRIASARLDFSNSPAAAGNTSALLVPEAGLRTESAWKRAASVQQVLAPSPSPASSRPLPAPPRSAFPSLPPHTHRLTTMCMRTRHIPEQAAVHCVRDMSARHFPELHWPIGMPNLPPELYHREWGRKHKYHALSLQAWIHRS